MAEYLNYDEEAPEPNIPSSTSLSWGSHAILASAFFIGGQYLLTQKTVLLHWESMLVSSLGMLSLSCLMIAFSWCRMYMRTGIVPGIFHSTLVNPSWSHGKFKFKASKGIVQSVLAGICSNLGYFIVFGSLFLGDYKGPGILAVIVVLVAILCGICNLILFDEQYTLMQMTGIVLITLGAEFYNIHWNFSEFTISTIGGILSLFLFTARGIMNKWASALEFDAYTGGLLGCLTDSLLSLLMWAAFFLNGNCSSYTRDDILVCIAAGISLGLGSFCLTYSVMIGNSGVSFALPIIQVLVMADVTTGFQFLEIPVIAISAGLCVFGLLVAIFGNLFCKTINCRCNFTINKKPTVLQMPLLEYTKDMYDG